ncbi:hypothetical protein [Gemmatimonas sp. UBA7669]|uniref:hypothetical protein n=1 Tax=Gemmatimonas sp. UBA7669 TaxID=1946568 RepID=UPI0025BEEF9F|nr:hypothetical protein [Gemmatimonas sp. UBA7669]
MTTFASRGPIQFASLAIDASCGTWRALDVGEPPGGNPPNRLELRAASAVTDNAQKAMTTMAPSTNFARKDISAPFEEHQMNCMT